MDKNPSQGHERLLRFFFLSLSGHAAVGFVAFQAVSRLGKFSRHLTATDLRPTIQLDWSEGPSQKPFPPQGSKARRVSPRLLSGLDHHHPDPKPFRNEERTLKSSIHEPVDSGSPQGIQPAPSTPENSSHYEEIRVWIASLLEGLELESNQGFRLAIELKVSDKNSTEDGPKITAVQFVDPPQRELTVSLSKNLLSQKSLSDQEKQLILDRLKGAPLPKHLRERAARQTFQIPIVIQGP